MFLVQTFYTKSQIIDNVYQTLVIYNPFSGYLDTHIINNCRLSIMSVTDIVGQVKKVRSPTWGHGLGMIIDQDILGRGLVILLKCFSCVK
jgi:hypothetical protein